MPELPEVETMAQDLAPLVRGAHVRDVWWDWDAAIREPAPAEFARRIAGRRIVDVGRRAKWLVADLSEQLVTST